MPMFYSYDAQKKIAHSVGVSDCLSEEIALALERASSSAEAEAGFIKLVDLECLTELQQPEQLPNRLRSKLVKLARKGCRKVVWLLPEDPKLARKLLEILGRLGNPPGQGLHRLMALAKTREELKKLLIQGA